MPVMTSSSPTKPTDPAPLAGDENKPQPHFLTEGYSSIPKEDLDFVREQTGIKDEDVLRQHIFDVQAEALSVHPYKYIKVFAFVKMKLSHDMPGYSALLKLGREREGAILLDIGCCRAQIACNHIKAVSDGFPVENCVATDIHPEFWDFGHRLFKSTQETFPARFFAGDVFNPEHLETVPPFTSPPTTPRPHLPTLNCLNPLRGHVSAIHISAVFHLFGEEQQVRLAHSIAGLLSPEPGSIIFGMQSGRAEKGFRVEAGRPTSHGGQMFCFSPETWREMWENVFPKGTIRVDANLKEVERPDLKPVSEDARFWLLTWCVTRL
ncbi:hypothetical protein GSI_07081 [Ganoderma sinense ZZ0214-1]|uniref:Methyltransferase domain-containing protein n=1 Tax=Ganoderma sinense ZZ0214-1 TaxID=1077348 RepID=A0A2G8SB02_9APHY|nr:hypothetical protein GSI_07081 [Ganoderma sinense ZZ0214-1]